MGPRRRQWVKQIAPYGFLLDRRVTALCAMFCPDYVSLEEHEHDYGE